MQESANCVNEAMFIASHSYSVMTHDMHTALAELSADEEGLCVEAYMSASVISENWAAA